VNLEEDGPIHQIEHHKATPSWLATVLCIDIIDARIHFALRGVYMEMFKAHGNQKTFCLIHVMYVQRNPLLFDCSMLYIHYVTGSTVRLQEI